MIGLGCLCTVHCCCSSASGYDIKKASVARDEMRLWFIGYCYKCIFSFLFLFFSPFQIPMLLCFCFSLLRSLNDFDLLQCSIIFCSYGCRHGARMTDLGLCFLLDLGSI